MAAAVALLAGCGGTVRVDSYPTAADSHVDCVGLLGDPPRTVAGQPYRHVEGRVAAAWGDPPIILRCGVEKPAALRPDSQCHEVNGVGWLAEKQGDDWLFTTIGRKHHVSLEVPSDYAPAGDALADIADVVARHDPVVEPCA